MKILIVGASIAGPALALSLADSGFDVTVVERAASLRPGGYAVDVRGAALQVVERLGLREVLRPLETDTLSNAVVDADGKTFGRIERGFGVIDEGDIEIHRGDLARVLFERTAASVDYRFGDSVASLDDSGGRVSVRFESGATEAFDAVVGGDGVHSRVRALAFGEESSFVRPLGSSMAIFTVPNHLGLVREQLLFAGIRRIASIKSANEDKDLKVCVFFSSEPGEFDYRDPTAQKRLVESAFQDAGWAFPELVAGMWNADDFYADITCQVRMPSYHAGRVALVGDAAYCPSPLSGQGSSLALVGAYLLAQALKENPGDPSLAFAAYEREMRPFAESNQEVALKIGKGFAPTSAFQVWFRNAMMRLFPYLPGKKAMMKAMMGGVRKAAHSISIPAAAS